MATLTKNQKAVAEKFDSHKLYPLAEACQVVKDITFTKFDATVELSANLGVDPRKANQMIRGVVTLPNGTGKVVRVLALCTPDKENEAKEAGADYVGLDDYIQKIKPWASCVSVREGMERNPYFLELLKEDMSALGLIICCNGSVIPLMA